jgi:zinc and cadmium transporter
MLEILLASLVIMLASLSGVFFIWKNIGKFLEKNLSYLVSFSAGVFLFVSFLLIQEVFHHGEETGNYTGGTIWIIVGILVFYGLFKILPNFHHHHDESGHDHTHNKIDARRVLISDGVHNIGDGILLTTSFLAGPIVGIVATTSIFIHEFVTEISEFFVLKSAGYKTEKALWINFLVSTTILFGAVGSYFAFEKFEQIEIPLLGLAAGSFLVVVVNDLIPHSIRNSKTKIHFAKHFSWFVIGIVIMLSISNVLVHYH